MAPILGARAYFSQVLEVVGAVQYRNVDAIADRIMEAYENNSTIFLFGNGGSASLASHFACDLAKGTCVPRTDKRRLRAIALTDNIPLITAWGNDSGYEHIFAQQLENMIRPHDIAIGISCSGNSPNVLNALLLARKTGATTIGLGGFKGGRMQEMCDLALIVPSDNMQVIEDVHLSVAHALFTIVRHRISMMSSDTKSMEASAHF